MLSYYQSLFVGNHVVSLPYSISLSPDDNRTNHTQLQAQSLVTPIFLAASTWPSSLFCSISAVRKCWMSSSGVNLFLATFGSFLGPDLITNSGPGWRRQASQRNDMKISLCAACWHCPVDSRRAH